MSFEGRLESGAIAALATPLGQSALAVIRTSGPNCIEMVSGGLKKPQLLRSAAGHTVVHSALVEANGDLIDDVLLAVFRAPRSYTGEDSVEIYAHGSIPGIDRIFSRLFQLGFRQALGGEFTMRAFVNGKLDLSRAEAIQELVSAQSREAHIHALHRLGGAVERRIHAIRDSLVTFMASVAIQLDYDEMETGEVRCDQGQLDTALRDIAELLGTYEKGRRYQFGARLALAGKTNAGKSSLFNALLKEERAIVSDVHGTTRDYLEARIIVRGVPVRLYDTAGFRTATDDIEREGIKRSGNIVEAATMVVYLVDGGKGPDEEDLQRLGLLKKEGHAVVVAWNKTDLEGSSQAPDYLEGFKVLGISALQYRGIDRLFEFIAEHINAAQSAGDESLLIDSQRQFELLERAHSALTEAKASLQGNVALDMVALDIQDALGALGEITGEVSSEEILDAVFSGFCVGK